MNPSDYRQIQPAVSQHLQILRKAGLVKGEMRGYWTHNMVDRRALLQIAAELNGLAAEEKTDKTICWRIIDTFEDKPKTEEADMCQNCRRQPNELMDKPENCTPEQIRQCHGDSEEHPCTNENCAAEPK